MPLRRVNSLVSVPLRIANLETAHCVGKEICISLLKGNVDYM